MRTFFSDVALQLKGIWARLDGGQRLVVASVLLATLAGLGGIVWYAGQPSYVVAHTAKSGEEIASARRALEQNNVRYVIADDGMAFLVDRENFGIARLAIREAGLASESGSVGLGTSSIIDDAETKSWKLANASIARAENAVRQLEGVSAVNITASPAKRTRAFVDRDQDSKPTATVLLKIRQGTPFEQVAFTAASATASQLGLPLQNITVSNTANGQRWKHDPDRDAGGGSSDFLSLQRSMGRNRTQQAQELLDQMWPGKTSINVNVELDPSWEVVSQRVLPETEIIKSEKTTRDTSDQETGSNGPRNGTSAIGPSDPSTKNNTKKETTDREFVTDIGERRSGKSAFEVKRLTVAVAYDRSLAETEGFSPESLANSVKAMVGWDKDRDSEDGFSVMVGDFAPIDASEVFTSSPGIADIALQWGPTVGQILGVVVVVFFLRGLFKRAKPGLGSADTGGSVVPGAMPSRDLSPEEQQKRMRREIERAIASDPAALAKLLESWLIEQKA